jgi:hypothetical protein
LAHRHRVSSGGDAPGHPGYWRQFMWHILIFLADSASALSEGFLSKHFDGIAIAALTLWQNFILIRGNKISERGRPVDALTNRPLFRTYWPLIAMAIILLLMWGNTLYGDLYKLDSIAVLVAILLAGIGVMWGSVWWTNLAAYRRTVRHSKLNFSRDLMAEMLGNYVRQNTSDGDILQIGEGKTMHSKPEFSPPISFRIIAKTSKTNIRIDYITRFIFRWECDNKQIRVDGGPFDGDHRTRIGNLPVDDWIIFDLMISKRSMSVWRNNEEVFFAKAAALDKFKLPIGVSLADSSLVSVKSVRADR